MNDLKLAPSPLRIPVETVAAKPGSNRAESLEAKLETRKKFCGLLRAGVLVSCTGPFYLPSPHKVL